MCLVLCFKGTDSFKLYLIKRDSPTANVFPTVYLDTGMESPEENDSKTHAWAIALAMTFGELIYT